MTLSVSRPLVLANLCFLALLAGCAKASLDTTGYAKIDEAVVNASFDETWQYVKDTLREQEYIIYTRDKRGYFQAYTDIKRRRFVPHRTEFSITLENVTSESTRVTVESSYQKYGVTLLTYPGWHARPTQDNERALRLLEGVQVKAGGGMEMSAGD